LLLDKALSLLRGDQLAADYLLSFLFCKRDSEGRGSLNHVNFVVKSTWRQEQGGEFARIADGIKSVMPLVKSLPLTIESLNASRFSSGVVDGALKQGELQLAPDTIIVVDETTLGTGTLAEKGVMNIAELKRIAEMGQVCLSLLIFL